MLENALEDDLGAVLRIDEEPLAVAIGEHDDPPVALESWKVRLHSSVAM
jgi:hypothetical protein